MIDSFWPLIYWHWWALAVVLAGIEIMAPSTFLLWPAMAAVAVGFLVLVLPDLGWPYQLLIYSIMAIVTTVLWLQYFRRHPIRSTHPTLNRRSAALVGRSVTVVEAVRNGIGLVRIDDTSWRARLKEGDSAEVGDTLRVTGFDGSTLIVVPERPLH